MDFKPHSKERIGDWEIDSIIGQNKKNAVISMVDRVSKFTVLKKVNSKKASIVAQAVTDGLIPFKNKVITITSDNGGEFAYHEIISKNLEASYYFARPYASWERGINENTNGLVRQYLKKGSSFSNVNDNLLISLMDKLNSRPRKSLNYLTPNEVFFT